MNYQDIIVSTRKLGASIYEADIENSQNPNPTDSTITITPPPSITDSNVVISPNPTECDEEHKNIMSHLYIRNLNTLMEK